MGLFDFLSGESNPNFLIKTEKETSKMFYELFIRRKNFEEMNFAEEKKTIAYRIYLHAFGRANKKAVPIEEMLDPFAMFKNSKIIQYVVLYKGIAITLDSKFSEISLFGQNINMSVSDETILGMIKIASEKLKSIG